MTPPPSLGRIYQKIETLLTMPSLSERMYCSLLESWTLDACDWFGQYSTEEMTLWFWVQHLRALASSVSWLLKLWAAAVTCAQAPLLDEPQEEHWGAGQLWRKMSETDHSYFENKLMGTWSVFSSLNLLVSFEATTTSLLFWFHWSPYPHFIIWRLGRLP